MPTSAAWPGLLESTWTTLRSCRADVGAPGDEAGVDQSPCNRLAAVGDRQLPEHSLEMGSNRVLADEESLGYGAVRHSGSHECKGLALASSEAPLRPGP